MARRQCKVIQDLPKGALFLWGGEVWVAPGKRSICARRYDPEKAGLCFCIVSNNGLDTRVGELMTPEEEAALRLTGEYPPGYG